MSHGWRALMMFGGGTLFGVVMGGVLYAPPELANQPPPWELWARAAGGPAAATHVAGAGPAQPVAAAPAAAPAPAPGPAVATEPIAAASAPASLEAAPAPVAAASAPVVVAASRPPAAARRKLHTEESAADTAPVAPWPAREAIRVPPEPLPAPAEAAPARADGEAYEAAR